MKLRYLFLIYIGLPILFIGLHAATQTIPGHGEVSRSLIITYVGPKDSVDFDMHWTRKSMRETPQIYCDGEFEVAIIRELNGLDGDLETVCTWDSKPDGRAGH